MMGKNFDDQLNASSATKKNIYFSLFILVCVGVFVFICSQNVLWIGDDWQYGYIFENGLDPHRMSDPRPIDSFQDVIFSQINHYSTTNGRVLAHTLVQSSCGLWGQTVFSFLNACIYICFILLLMNICGMKLESLKATISATTIILISFPTKMVPSTQIGYIWGAALILAFIKLFFTHRQDSIVCLVLIFLVSLCAGNSHEAYSIGISVALIIYWGLNFRQFSARQWVMIVGFGIGTLLICLSPAASARASVEHKPISQNLFFLFSSLRVTYILIVYLIYKLIHKKISIKSIYKEYSFFWNTIIALLIFNFTVGIMCNRQLFGIELMSAIILFRMIPKHSFNTFWTWTFGLLTIVFCYFHTERIYLYQSQLMSIESQYQESKDGIVYQDVSDINLFTDISYAPHLWDTGYHGSILKRIMAQKYPGHKPLVLVPSYMRGKMHKNLGNMVYNFKYKHGKLLCIQSKTNPAKFVVTRKFFGVIPYQRREMDFQHPYFETDSIRAIIYDELNPIVLNTEVNIY